MSKRRRWELIILLVMYLGYTCFMICRNTAIVASPAMIADPGLGLDKAAYGRMMAYHSIGGVIGKIFSGVAVDRWGGRLIFLLMLGLTAATTAAFGLFSKFSVLAGFNGAGQAFKSGGWPAMAGLIRSWYSPEMHGRVWGIISTSSRVGVMTATFFLGNLLERGVNWRHIFFISAGLALAVVVLGYFFLRSGPHEVGLPPPTDRGQEVQAHSLDGQTLAQASVVFLKSPRVWLICISMGLTTILMDFLNFIPVYLAETLKLSPGTAGKATTAFPAGMFVSVLISGYLYDKVTKKQRVLLVGGLLLTGVASPLSLYYLPALNLDAVNAYWCSVLAIFLFGAAVAPSYYLPMAVFAISFGGPFCGFLICAFDVFGYACASVFNYFGGTIAQDFGWSAFLMTLVTLTVTATVTVSSFLLLDAKRSGD